MTCKLDTLCAPDGTKVNVNVNTDFSVSHTVANSQGTPWTGDIDSLEACECIVCEPVDYTCTAQAETASLGGSVQNHTLQQRELVRGQLGEAVTAAFIGGNDIDINPTDNPITITLPAHAAGSVLALHLAYGGENRSIAPGHDTILDPTVTATGAIANLTTMWEIEPDTPILDVGSAIYYMDASSGAAGSTITIDFDTFDIPTSGNKPGVVQWVVKEYVSNLGTLTVADFDTPVPVEVAPSTSTPDVANPPLRTHAAVDLGDCDAPFYATARHVKEDNDDGTNFYDANWATMTTGGAGYDEEYDISSVDYATVCQLGITSGLVSGGNGPTAYSYQQNYHWSQFNNQIMSAGVYIPLVCLTAGADDQFEEVCEVVAINQCTDQAVSVSCRLQAEVALTVDAGNSLTVTPFINGTAVTSAAQTLTSSGTVTIDAVAAGANIAAGGANTTHSFYLQLSGVGSASANAWTGTCTTTPV